MAIGYYGLKNMFCSRCSHKQVSEEIRYCTRCGYQLGPIEQVFAYGGNLPQSAEIYNKQKVWLTRSNGLRFGLTWFLILTLLLTPILVVVGGERSVPMTLALALIGAVLITIFSFMFLKNEPQNWNLEHFGPLRKERSEDDAGLGKNKQNVLLPPQESMPASTFVPPMYSWKSPETEDLARSRSATKETSKLFCRDK